MYQVLPPAPSLNQCVCWDTLHRWFRHVHLGMADQRQSRGSALSNSGLRLRAVHALSLLHLTAWGQCCNELNTLEALCWRCDKKQKTAKATKYLAPFSSLHFQWGQRFLSSIRWSICDDVMCKTIPVWMRKGILEKKMAVRLDGKTIEVRFKDMAGEVGANCTILPLHLKSIANWSQHLHHYFATF